MTCSGSHSFSVARLGLEPRCLWPGACAFSTVQYGGEDEGAFWEERVQGPFSVVPPCSHGLCEPRKVTFFPGLPQPQLGLSPPEARVAPHAEEVVTGAGRPAEEVAGEGVGRRVGRLVLLGTACRAGRDRPQKSALPSPVPTPPSLHFPHSFLSLPLSAFPFATLCFFLPQ